MIEFLKPQLRASLHEIDLYGFSEILEEITKIKRPRKPMATWVHGWNYQPLSSPRVLSAFGEYLHYRRIVRSIEEKNILEEYGFKNIIIGGLPFQYVNRSKIERKPGSLIVMGEHSLSPDKRESIIRWNKLIEEVDVNYKSKFDEIKICMTGEDYHCGPIRKMIDTRGYDVIIGSFKNDANSLMRMRQIFDYFDFGITTCLGSHLVYAHYSGCKMGIVGKYFGMGLNRSGEYGRNYAGNNLINDEKIYDNYVLSLKPRKDFEFLFIDEFKDLLSLENYFAWSFEQIGGENKFSNAQLADVVAWSGAEYLVAAYKYTKDKILNRRSC